MGAALLKLKGYTALVMRDLRQQLDDIIDPVLRKRVITKFALVSQLLHQQAKDAEKIYVRIPEYPPTHSDNMRPLVPGYPPTRDALP